MNKNNPACYECPKGKNKLHTWISIVKHQTNVVIGAQCKNCKLVLTKEQAEDVWRNC